MNKITVAFAVAATLLGMVSCQKEKHPAERMTGPMTISAVAEGMDAMTKTELSYTYDVLWKEDDRIYVKSDNENASFILTEGAGTTKGTFKQEGSATISGNVEAFYPSAIALGSVQTWPAVQTLNQAAPMYCKKVLSGSSSEEFSFSSLGSMLQIVLQRFQEGISLKSIEITDGKKTMSGNFTINDKGQAVITDTDGAGITLNFNESFYLWNDINYFYVSIPAGEYENLTVTFRATNGTRYVFRPKEKVIAERNKVSRILAAADFTQPEGVLSGKFSVSRFKQVMFSKGNLRYSIGTGTWSFYDKQYEFGPKDYSSGHGNEVSLFTWGYNATKSIIPDGKNSDNVSLEAGNLSQKEDWGSAIGEPGDWRTLTREEWYYLLGPGDSDKLVELDDEISGLVSGDERKGRCRNGVNVCGVANCLIIAPDDWDLSAHPLQDSYSSGSSSSMSWEEAEAAGLVCLPPAGIRKGASVIDAGSYGYYWSSSAYSGTGAYLNFYGSSGQSAILYPVYRGKREEGRSVRLVTNAY